MSTHNALICMIGQSTSHTKAILGISYMHYLFSYYLYSFSFFKTSKYEMYLSNIYRIYKYVVWDVGKYNFLSKIVVELPLRKTFANWAEGLKFTKNLRSLNKTKFIWTVHFHNSLTCYVPELSKINWSN